MASCLADTKIGIQALLPDQLCMSAALDDMSVVQYKDLIGVADGFQTVAIMMMVLSWVKCLDPR